MCFSVAVVVAFFICWAPFHTQRLMYIYHKPQYWTPAVKSLHNILFYISGVLYYVSSVINPILYNIMSLKFRQAFRNTICRPCKRQRKRPSLQTYRFCANRHKPLDTNLTFMQVQLLNGMAGKKKEKGGPYSAPAVCLYKYTPATAAAARSNSGSHSAGSPGPSHSQRDEELGMLDGDLVLNELKSFHSYHPRSSSTSNPASRPYHSYA